MHMYIVALLFQKSTTVNAQEVAKILDTHGHKNYKPLHTLLAIQQQGCCGLTVQLLHNTTAKYCWLLFGNFVKI